MIEKKVITGEKKYSGAFKIIEFQYVEYDIFVWVSYRVHFNDLLNEVILN